jgi:hypothetical protein
LAFVGGANNFQFKGEGEAGTNYPVHMELNEWAKNELGKYCESLFEEKEDELTAAVIAAEEGGSKTLADAICKEELDLCHPPPPPPPPPPPGSEPKLSKAERMKKAKEVFESMDNNSDGFVDKREIQGRMKNAQREGKLSASTTVKAEVARFFAVDANGDGKVSRRAAAQTCTRRACVRPPTCVTPRARHLVLHREESRQCAAHEAGRALPGVCTRDVTSAGELRRVQGDVDAQEEEEGQPRCSR